MICVTGMARTGTSMIMQTLVHLGVPTPSKPFIDEHKLILDKNPKGFYEMYDEVINGINHHKYKGQAVKLFAGCLNQTPKIYVDKVIVMLRDRDDTIKSYTPIHNILNDEYTPEYIYDATYYILDEYLINVNHIFITFEDMLTNPNNEIQKIVKFLGIKPTNKQIFNAIKNIDLCQ